MSTYASVDERTRRRLDEMLQTWKHPVAGSLDTRPVFPLDITLPIDNGLLKARTAFVQQHQQQQFRAQQEMARGRGMSTPNNGYTNTPTPPQTRGHFPPPQPQGFQQPHFPPQNYPQQQHPNAAANSNFQVGPTLNQKMSHKQLTNTERPNAIFPISPTTSIAANTTAVSAAFPASPAPTISTTGPAVSSTRPEPGNTTSRRR